MINSREAEQFSLDSLRLRSRQCDANMALSLTEKGQRGGVAMTEEGNKQSSADFSRKTTTVNYLLERESDGDMNTGGRRGGENFQLELQITVLLRGLGGEMD